MNDLMTRVEQACAALVESNNSVTFREVAKRVGVATSTLYRRADLRVIVEEHRARTRDAHGLAELIVELDHLRQGLEALAAKVRRHEEELRTIRRWVSAGQ